MLVLGYLFALIIGLTLGLLGGGGSILTVPVFVYVLRYDPKLAIAMSLPVVGATSVIGAIGYWRAGNVRLRTAIIFGGVSMASAFLAARLSIHVPGRAQLFVLGGTMLTASALMLRDSFRAPQPPPTRDSRLAVSDSRPSTPGSRLILPLSGLFVGALTGVIGIGGGFLIVPVFVLLAHLPMRQAVGTSLAVITMNAAAGLAGQTRIGEIPLDFVMTFSGVAIAGIVAGTWLTRHVHQNTLKRAFAALLLVIAALLLWQNRAFQ